MIPNISKIEKIMGDKLFLTVCGRDSTTAELKEYGYYLITVANQIEEAERERLALEQVCKVEDSCEEDTKAE